MKKIKRISRIKRKEKNRKRNNFKKIILSSLAAFSLITAIGISSWGNNDGTKNSLVNNNTTKNATTASTLVPPTVNDLYDDYAYANGFVTITNNSVINFYDWFGFASWSYNLNANATSLFGNQNLRVATLHVKSSTDGNLIYVYGYLSDDTSYLFALNTTDGLISPIGNHNSFYGNDLIKDINLLTVVNGSLILTPKTPNDESTSGGTITITFSEIDLTTGTVATNNWDITGSQSSLGVTTYGEIISVQKVETNYLFIMKAIVYNGSNKTQTRACVIYVDVKGGTYQKYGGLNASFWIWTTPSDPIGTDLDMADFTVMNTTSEDGSTSYSYVTVKYDTTSTTLGNPGPTDGSVQDAYYQANSVSYSTLTASAPSVSVVSYQSNDTTSDSFVGISQLLINPIDNTPSAIFLDANSTSKIAIQSLSNINTVTSGKTITVTPSWIDLNTSGITTSDSQILSFGFIPGTTVQNSSGYSGYLNVQAQNDSGTSQLTSSSTFFSLDTSGTTLTQLTLGFSYAVTQSDIDKKYVYGKYKVTDSNKNTLVNELINDLIGINLNGSPYSGVKYTSNIVADSISNTLKGEVTLIIQNWWNTGTTQVTRSVDIDLNKITVNTDVTVQNTNVMTYAAIILAILVVIAAILVVIKICIKKKINEILVENQVF